MTLGAGDLVALRYREGIKDSVVIVWRDGGSTFSRIGQMEVGELVIFFEHEASDPNRGVTQRSRVLTRLGLGWVFRDRLSSHAMVKA